ncbi:MAG: YibE/F family protein [Nocardioidaceae bacterium]
MRFVLAAFVVPLIAATLVGIVTLWPDSAAGKAPEGFALERAHGTITALNDCKDGRTGCVTATVDLTSGPGAPGEAKAALIHGADAPEYAVGDDILLGYAPKAPADERYTFVDFDRTSPLLLLAGVFVAGVLLLSRWRGVGSLVSLVGSLALIVYFTLPNLLVGQPPLLIAVLTASAIMIGSLYLSHGVSLRSSIALIGTVAALALTGVLGLLFTEVGQFTGFADETSGYLKTIVGTVDLSGLLLAGLVIGALGVLDDVTVTQAAAVWELAEADPIASRRSLFAQGMRIGRAHVASTVNTLVLAYVGATLPLLLIFSATEVPFADLVTLEVISQEVVRGLVGSLGIIAAVPITTGLAAVVAAQTAGERVHQTGAGR